LKSITFEGSQPTLSSNSFAIGASWKSASATIYTTGWGSSSVFTSDVIGSYSTLTYVTLPTVTFKLSNGTNPIIIATDFDSVISNWPNNPVKVNCVFTGWYSDYSCTVLFDVNTMISADITLYAGYDVISVSVSFDIGSYDNVTVPGTQTIANGSCATIPDLTVNGFTVKWYSDPTLTAEYDFASSITADTTLYLGLTAVVVPVDPDPQTDEGLTSDVDSMLIAGLILLIIGIITLVCMFAIGFPPINPIVIIVDLAVIAAGAILIFFGV